MRTLALILLLVCCFLQPVFSDDMITKKGVVYKDAIIVQVTGDKVVIWYSGGDATIPSNELPDNLFRLYCDPSLAVLPDPLMLNDGTILQSPHLMGFDPEGITISHKDGVGRFPFYRLPVILRMRYPYNDKMLTVYLDLRERRSHREKMTDDSSRDVSDGVSYAGSAGFSGGSGYHSSGGEVQVRGYYRKDGTYVHGYTRKK
jgi:hypothetical protein